MNGKRRDRLREAMRMLTQAAAIVESVCDAEQDCVDNYPENLQGTERFENMEVTVDILSNALEEINDAKSHVEAAIGG